MKKNILLIAFLFSIQIQLSAQITYDPKFRPTKLEKELDIQIQKCTNGTNLTNEFQFVDWIAKLHYLNKKLIQRASSEYVEDIASKKNDVIALSELSNTCETLKKVQPELAALKKLYEKKIKVANEDADNFADGKGTNKSSMTKNDAEDIIKIIEKIRKKMAITQVITRL
jgi:hypothetical protein